MKKIYNNPVGESKYTGLILVIPFIIGFVLFALYPFLSSLILSFTEYKINKAMVFGSMENYKQLLKDENLKQSIFVTFKYVLMLVPLKLVISMAVALILNQQIKGMSIYRTLFYIPSILGSNISIVIMWSYLFTSNGLINQILEKIGGSPISWYGEATPAMWVIVLLRLWEFGSTMIIFLNAFQGIPIELYDAAKVDGAGKIRTFFKITLPMLKNVIFINLIIQVITAFQEFNAPFLITSGNPLKSTYTISMLIYDSAFKYYDLGYANAISWVLFLILTIITIILFKITKRIRES